MAVNYCGICVTNVIKHNLTLYGSNILHHFNPQKSKVKITAAIYHGIFITLALGVNVIKLFTAVIYRSNLWPFHGNTVILCYKAT
jgi:hypothetical protein